MHIIKRIFLFVAVNILVMLTITMVLGVLRVGYYFPAGGLAGLAVFCLVWGFAGALISLALSRLMAKWMMGVRVIPDRKSTRLNSSHGSISYAVFCLKKKKDTTHRNIRPTRPIDEALATRKDRTGRGRHRYRTTGENTTNGTTWLGGWAHMTLVSATH